ncbi:uncharacterized protein [Haliotis asinina]|uniref:uncharacterized protein n=1 Tax=Haliotis asinina TaxID=109174 RepID=UPI00353260A6
MQTIQFGGLFHLRAGYCIKLALLLTSALPFVYLYLYKSFHKEQHRGISFGDQGPSSTKPNDTKEIIVPPPAGPLLTMFTTWPANDREHTVRNNTLKNWAKLKPHVRPVFFSCNMKEANDIIQHGWEVLPVSKTAALGVPVLKYMFLDAIRRFKSNFYAYSNGDILFDEGLINTLRTVVSAYFPPTNPILITGQRTNVQNVTAAEATKMERLSTIAKQRGKLFITLAEDYFITDSTFPWGKIPGIVIGRPAYDNWLVLNSCKHDHTVIDATATILAAHQTTKVGNYEGTTRRSTNFNFGLLYGLYRTVKYTAGSTSCAPLVSNRNETGIYISRRTRFSRSCYHFYRLFGNRTKLDSVPASKNK